MNQPAELEQGRPVVLRGGTVLTMDDRREIRPDTDVLVIGDRIAAIGAGLEVPPGTVAIDASDGIVMPGMIDTHRHMWQTATRSYGADWTLTNYLKYLLQCGRRFRPEDVFAGNLLAALEAIDAGVTTTVDWSHGLRTVDHADAAADALQAVPGRFILAYGNLYQPPAEWATSAAFRDFVNRRITGDMLGLQIAIDVLGRPDFPEKPAFEAARELGVRVTSHTGCWNTATDASVKLVYDHGFMTPGNVYVHAATLSADSYHRIAATGGSVSVSAESEQSAGQGYPPTRALRAYGIPVSLSTDTGVWWSADLFSAMRATLGADRAHEHMAAHANGATVENCSLRSEQVVAWATRGGADAIGRGSDLGRLEAGKKADIVLIKNDDSPVSFPILNPYGHVVFQAQRGDVHTVLVNGRVVKHNHRLIGADLNRARRLAESTIEYLRLQAGEEWETDMTPELPEPKILENPYRAATLSGATS